MVQAHQKYLNQLISVIEWLKSRKLWVILILGVIALLLKAGLGAATGVVIEKEIEPVCQKAFGYQTDDDERDEMINEICQRVEKSIQDNVQSDQHFYHAQQLALHDQQRRSIEKVEQCVKESRITERTVHVCPERAKPSSHAHSEQVRRLIQLNSSTGLTTDEIETKLYNILN